MPLSHVCLPFLNLLNKQTNKNPPRLLICTLTTCQLTLKEPGPPRVSNPTERREDEKSNTSRSGPHCKVSGRGMGLELRPSNFSKGRKDDWLWGGGGQGQGGSREGKWAHGRICGSLRQKEAGERKKHHDTPPLPPLASTGWKLCSGTFMD